MKKPTSMSTLILWNISKALEINPYMDLKVIQLAVLTIRVKEEA